MRKWEIRNWASSLYARGWRSEDRDLLVRKYAGWEEEPHPTESEIDIAVEWLAVFEMEEAEE